MQDFVFVRKNNRYEKIEFSELIFVKAMRGYMQLVTESQVYFVLNTIEEVEKHLSKELFCRIHRGYIVAINRIQSFDNWKLILKPPPDGTEYCAGLSRQRELPVGKSFRRRLRQCVNIIPNRMNRNVKKIMNNAEFLLACTVGEEE